MVCIFVNKNYKIYKTYGNGKEEFIVHNKNKKFEDAHTHINNFKLAKIIIYCCLEGKFPSRCKRLESNYRVVESITRVCTNKYKNKFDKMLYNIKNK